MALTWSLSLGAALACHSSGMENLIPRTTVSGRRCGRGREREDCLWGGRGTVCLTLMGPGSLRQKFGYSDLKVAFGLKVQGPWITQKGHIRSGRSRLQVLEEHCITHRTMRLGLSKGIPILPQGPCREMGPFRMLPHQGEQSRVQHSLTWLLWGLRRRH